MPMIASIGRVKVARALWSEVAVAARIGSPRIILAPRTPAPVNHVAGSMGTAV